MTKSYTLVFGMKNCTYHEQAKNNFRKQVGYMFFDCSREALQNLKDIQEVDDVHLSPLVFTINNVVNVNEVYKVVDSFFEKKVEKAKYCKGGYSGMKKNNATYH